MTIRLTIVTEIIEQFFLKCFIRVTLYPQEKILIAGLKRSVDIETAVYIAYSTRMGNTKANTG